MKIKTYSEWEKYGVTAGYCADFDGHFRHMNPRDGENFEKVAACFNLKKEQMLRMRQTHTDLVLPVDRTNGGEGIVKNEVAESYDGIITNAPELMLCVVTADCTPVFLYDKVKKAVGMVHSGRAGTIKDIAGKAVDKMCSEYQSVPADILCILGPYISQAHHEVEKKDIEGFYGLYSQTECESFLLSSGEKYYVDMGQAIRTALMRRGVLDESIIDHHVCTYEDKGLFSWRRDHNPDARILSFVFINE